MSMGLAGVSMNTLATALMQRFDSNNDGKLDIKEFGDLMTTLLARLSNTTSSMTPGVGTGVDLIRPTVSSSNEEWQRYFSALVAQRGVGPAATPQALAALERDLLAAGATLQRTSAGEIRGRIYLPTGNPADPWGRAVDVVRNMGWGQGWTWIPR
jgi:hypothetical protein